MQSSFPIQMILWSSAHILVDAVCFRQWAFVHLMQFGNAPVHPEREIHLILMGT